MPEFIPPSDIAASKYDDFTKGYLEALFWIGILDDEKFENYSVESGTGLTLADVDPKALEEIISDCADFQSANAEQLDKYEDISGHDLSYAGHDFFLTRNGHGTGFWNRGIGEIGEALTKAAEVYGTQGLYLGDDGKLYIHN